jgi:hypothetical protein
LDAEIPGNSEWDRTPTHFLYGCDAHYRLGQDIMREAIGLNASHFNTHRMIQEYAAKAYVASFSTSIPVLCCHCHDNKWAAIAKRGGEEDYQLWPI